jgi:hypothetical protein
VPESDELIPVNFPPPDAGSPEPIVLADDRNLLLAYHIARRRPVVSELTDELEQAAVIAFEGYRQYRFGSPNDEALEAHELSKRGLRPYRPAEVLRSSWLAELERMNRVHPRHDPSDFAGLRHIVIPLPRLDVRMRRAPLVV